MSGTESINSLNLMTFEDNLESKMKDRNTTSNQVTIER